MAKKFIAYLASESDGEQIWLPIATKKEDLEIIDMLINPHPDLPQI
jgi:hypothetical protein